MRIRCAVAAEQFQLEDIQRRASLATEEYRAALLANPDAIALPISQILAGRIFVAESAGKILGFSAVIPRTDGDADLDGLFVDPTHSRKGIGTELVRDAAHRAGGKGARVLHVVANPRAEAFYMNCGFEFVAEVQTRFGPARTMRKLLDEFA